MNRRLFGRDIAINEPMQFNFTTEEVRLTQLDYTDALSHAPFAPSVYTDLRKIEITKTPASLDSWKTLPNGTYRGTWGTRLSKYVKEKYKYNLDTKALSVLIESLGHSTNDATTPYTITFTNHADWKPGLYGDHNSCWFTGSYGSSRTGLLSSGGGAILVHKDNAPFGRLWYYPMQGGDFCALFNIYDIRQGSLTLLGIARLLAMKFDISYMRARDVYFPGAYINGEGSAYLAGINLVDRPISLLFARPRFTVNVHGFLPEDSPAKVESGEDEEDVMIMCNGCGREYHRDDTNTVDGDDYCEDCFAEDYFWCCECEQNFHQDYCNYVENVGDVCDSCFGHEYSHCDKCGNAYHNDAMHETSDETWICESCASDYYYLCENCGKYCQEPSTILYHDREQQWCDNCVDDSSVHECGACNALYYEEHECPEEADDDPQT